MPKAKIHPTWYPEAKVICNGEVVAIVGSTQPELHVDVWSGNHPFYTGTQKIIDAEGRVERFMRKYGMVEDGKPLAMAVVPHLTKDVRPTASEKAEAKAAEKGKGKKKK